MSREELLARIAWNYLVEPGDRVAGVLISTLGPELAMAKLLEKSVSAVGEVSQDEIHNSFERWTPRLVPGRAAELLVESRRRGVFPVTPEDARWPKSFQDLGNHQPILLWAMGNRENLMKLDSAISVVGSRTITPYGNWSTTEIVAGLSDLGIATVSGGALGVDSVVHRSTLRFAGTTIAVMAGGLFNLYPAGNHELFEQIIQKGLLLSEMTPDARPTRWRFLQRNRLIAALGNSVIVTEAGYRSGSINTVNHAHELGRPVYAVPGPVNSPSSAGCNRLIAEGKAEIISDLDSLPELLGLKQAPEQTRPALGQLELRLLDALSTRFQDQGELAALAGFNQAEMRLAVGGLELLGMVKRNGQSLSKTS